MEQTKKKRLPFSWFDVILIVLILAAAATAYVLSHRDAEVQNYGTTSYVMEFSMIPEDELKEIPIGAAVTDNIKNYAMGTVTAVEITPALISATDEAADVVRKTELPGYVTLLVTVEADTVETEKAITAESGYILREGASVSCRIGLMKYAGYIVILER